MLRKAKRRLDRLKGIAPEPNLGDAISLKGYETSVNELQSLEEGYNTLVSELDARSAVIKDKERMVNDYRARMLAAIAAVYGRNSEEYAAAGGTKTSEKKRTTLQKFSSSPGTTS